MNNTLVNCALVYLISCPFLFGSTFNSLYICLILWWMECKDIFNRYIGHPLYKYITSALLYKYVCTFTPYRGSWWYASLEMNTHDINITVYSLHSGLSFDISGHGPKVPSTCILKGSKQPLDGLCKNSKHTSYFFYVQPGPLVKC